MCIQNLFFVIEVAIVWLTSCKLKPLPRLIAEMPFKFCKLQLLYVLNS